MKALFETRPAGHSRRRFRQSVLGGALASLLACGSIFGQGAYYPGPVSPPPGVTLNISSTSISTDPNLAFLQGRIGSLYPGVALATPPTAAQLSAAVTSCVVDIQNGVESGVPGVNLVNFSNVVVAFSPTAVVTTSSAIGQGIVQVDFTTNNNPTQAITDLTTVATALAFSQPTIVSTMLQGLLGPATTGANAAMLAPGVSQIVLGAISQIPGNIAQISVAVGAGQAAIVGANVPAMTKNTLYLGYVGSMIGSSGANNNPSVISTMIQVLSAQKFQTTASLQSILNAAVNAMPAQNNVTLGALTDGALVSNGNVTGGPANVASFITGAMNFSGNAVYVNQVVNGYTSATTRANLDTALTSNPGSADAIASGAVTRGLVAVGLIMQDALTNSGGANPAAIVQETILANQTSAVSALEGGINTTAHEPYGYPTVTFNQVALGAAGGAPITTIGTLIQILITDSSASVSTFVPATVQGIVQNGIDGAAVNNPGAFGDIVYKAMLASRDTAGVAGPLTSTAITEIQAKGGLPYIAPVAAVAGGGTVGTNRTDIATAANTMLTGQFLSAADQGMALVQALQANNSTHYVDILNAVNTAANPAVPANANGDAVRADIYAAMMADPNDYDGVLAAALKETVGNPNNLTSQGSPVTDITLLGDANNGIRGLNSNVSANLQVVDLVVTHIQNEALGLGQAGVGDIWGFISHTVITAPSLVKSIAVAGTVADPDHAHFIASAIGYQAPLTAYTAIPSIFTYAQITNPHPLVLTNSSSYSGAVGTAKTFPGTFGAIMDQPAAAAAITAGLTDGIMAANAASPTTFNVQTALSTAIAAAVTASITQNNTPLQGLTNPFNAVGSTSLQFQQSTGASISASTNARTVGAAGAITGYIADVTQASDTTISPLTQAVLTAAVAGSARPYALQMAQAAAQAFAWVTQPTALVTAIPSGVATGNPVYDIAESIFLGVGSSYASLTQLENAVAFGINQAERGVIGAGALGLNAVGINSGVLSVAATLNPNGNFYIHRSGTGTPVTDIFNL